MASSDLVLSTRREMYIGDVEANRPNSESINKKISGNINYLLDNVSSKEKFIFNGYLNSSTSLHSRRWSGAVRIKKPTELVDFSMILNETGDSGITEINILVLDINGVSLGYLWDDAPEISGGNGVSSMIGVDSVQSNAPDTYLMNMAGHTYNHGVLNPALITIPAGSMLIPEVIQAGVRANTLTLDLKLREVENV